MVLRHLWDQSHIWWLGNHGTSSNHDFLVSMGLHCKNFRMKSHVWLRDTYGTGPICSCGTAMRLDLYISLRHLWDQSHILL